MCLLFNICICVLFNTNTIRHTYYPKILFIAKYYLSTHLPRFSNSVIPIRRVLFVETFAVSPCACPARFVRCDMSCIIVVWIRGSPSIRWSASANKA